MGVVYKARQKGLKRLVALKMVLSGNHASPQQLARFKSEAEALAGLQHPNIVQVYEVGEWCAATSDLPLPYFALEYMADGSLDKHLNGTPLTPRESAQLLQTLAQAIQLAHQHGIIHRDLKPANILLQKNEGGRKNHESREQVSPPFLHPKITDFGLAKDLDASQGPTASGAIMGTPSYMAPEQALGKIKQIGPATDVYALGAILYECLTGRPPFRSDTPAHTLMQVVADEPVSPCRLQAKVPRDLETICLKCLEKSPHRRFRSALELADELGRYLNNVPTLARPVGLGMRALKWAWRRPGIAAMLALVLVTTMVSFLLLGRQWLSVVFTAQAQAAARQKAEEARKLEADRAASEARSRQDLAQAVLSVEAQRRKVEQNLVQYYRLEANRLAQMNQWEDMNQLLVRIPEPSRDEEWHRLQRLYGPDRVTWKVSSGLVAFSRDSLYFASSGVSGHDPVTVFNMETGQAIHILKGHQGMVQGLVFSPDNRWLVSVDWGTIRVWDVHTGHAIRSFKCDKAVVTSILCSPDGRRLAIACGDNVAIWDVQTGQKRLTFDGVYRSINSMSYSPDGRLIVTAESSRTSSSPGRPDKRSVGGLYILDAQTGQELRTLEGNNTQRVAFSADGRRLASSHGDLIKVRDVQTGQVLITLAGYSTNRFPRSGIDSSLTFSHDGRFVASANGDYTVKIWDILTTGQELLTLKGHTQEVNNVMFSSNGRRLASASTDQTVKIWDLSSLYKKTATIPLPQK